MSVARDIDGSQQTDEQDPLFSPGEIQRALIRIAYDAGKLDLDNANAQMRATFRNAQGRVYSTRSSTSVAKYTQTLWSDKRAVTGFPAILVSLAWSRTHRSPTHRFSRICSGIHCQNT